MGNIVGTCGPINPKILSTSRVTSWRVYMLHNRCFFVHKLTGIKISKWVWLLHEVFHTLNPRVFHRGFGGKDGGIMVQIEKEFFQDLFWTYLSQYLSILHDQGVVLIAESRATFLSFFKDACYSHYFLPLFYQFLLGVNLRSGSEISYIEMSFWGSSG